MCMYYSAEINLSVILQFAIALPIRNVCTIYPKEKTSILRSHRVNIFKVTSQYFPNGNIY